MIFSSIQKHPDILVIKKNYRVGSKIEKDRVGNRRAITVSELSAPKREKKKEVDRTQTDPSANRWRQRCCPN
jgi:hypothetical protein